MVFNSNPSVNKIRHYTNFVMVALYLALGLLFLFTDAAIDTFPVYRKEVGVVFIVYAAFRTFITIRKLKKENEQQN